MLALSLLLCSIFFSRELLCLVVAAIFLLACLLGSHPVASVLLLHFAGKESSLRAHFASNFLFDPNLVKLILDYVPQKVVPVYRSEQSELLLRAPCLSLFCWRACCRVSLHPSRRFGQRLLCVFSLVGTFCDRVVVR